MHQNPHRRLLPPFRRSSLWELDSACCLVGWRVSGQCELSSISQHRARRSRGDAPERSEPCGSSTSDPQFRQLSWMGPTRRGDSFILNKTALSRSLNFVSVRFNGRAALKRGPRPLRPRREDGVEMNLIPFSEFPVSTSRSRQNSHGAYRLTRERCGPSPSPPLTEGRKQKAQRRKQGFIYLDGRPSRGAARGRAIRSRIAPGVCRAVRARGFAPS